MTDEAEDFEEVFKEETEETVETEETELKGETEVNEETQETEETAPPADKEEIKDEPKLVPIAALHDKARRVQELREENEKLKSQIPQSEQKPDMYEDPEGYEKWVEAKAEAKFLEQQEAKEMERLQDSRSTMLESHTDYLEVEEVFMFMSRNNQPLTDEMLSNPNPANFAYEKGKAYLKGQEDTIRAKILAESSSETTETTTETSIAPSLASATDAGSNTTQVEKEETMDEMFEDQGY